jgi:hypothetical protein
MASRVSLGRSRQDVPPAGAPDVDDDDADDDAALDDELPALRGAPCRSLHARRMSETRPGSHEQCGPKKSSNGERTDGRWSKEVAGCRNGLLQRRFALPGFMSASLSCSIPLEPTGRAEPLFRPFLRWWARWRTGSSSGPQPRCAARRARTEKSGDADGKFTAARVNAHAARAIDGKRHKSKEVLVEDGERSR